MNHNIKKEHIFNFLKSESIIEPISSSEIISIEEKSNTDTTSLCNINIVSLNNDSNYWRLNPENKTFLEPNSKKVENVILEYTKDKLLNIMMIEMKSKTIKRKDENAIVEKFEKSLSWVYLLLNLLDDKQNQKINVYGVLVAQKDKKWNSKETLNIFSSTSIRYKKISFYTTNTTIDIDLNSILN